MTRRAAAAPENCCWPVTRRPSRTAKSRNIWSTTKLVPGIFRASSSIQNGWMRLPTKLSANRSSLFAKPVQVFPSTSSFPLESFVSSSRQVPWQTRAAIFPD